MIHLSSIMSLVLLCILPESILASTPYNNLKFEHLSIKENLPHHYVNAIIQDRNGYMWFGTKAGIAKYDGFSITTFDYLNAESNTISSNIITSLIEDKSGKLWIGTTGGGLDVYDPMTGDIKNHQQSNLGMTSLSSNNIRSLFEDSKGRLWIGTEGGGLNRMNVERTVITRISVNDSTLVNSDVIFDFFEKENSLWICTGRGLFEYNDITDRFTRYLPNPNQRSWLGNSITAITGSPNGTIWVGNELGSVFQFDTTTRRFIELEITLDVSQYWHKSGITSLFVDSRNILWIGTWDGLILYNSELEKISLYNHEEFDAFSICDGSILSIFQDHSGLIWLGTADGGISKYDYRKGSFKHEYVKDIYGGLSNSLINDLETQQDGTLWVATSVGLNRLKPSASKYDTYYPIEGEKSSLSDHSVNSLLTDSKNNLWIGTSNGLNLWDDKTQTFKKIELTDNHEYIQSNDNVSDIEEDNTGDIWVGTYYYGIIVIDSDSGESKRLLHDQNDSTSLSTNRISTIYKDTNGSIWVGTFDSGLDRYDAATNSFTHYGYDEQYQSNLIGVHVNCIFDNGKGVYWIGTNLGLNEFRLEGRNFKLVSKKQGLAGTVIHGILSDEKGNLWLSTNSGISKFNINDRSIINYSISDGVQGNEFRSNSYHKSSTGELFFGGNNGFNRFFPEMINENTFPPFVVITDFKVFNHSITSLGIPDKITLPYDSNFFSFEFAALDYSFPANNKLAYMLDGVDKEWIYPVGRRTAIYTGVEPGEYVFRVKGSNNHGIWNDQVLSVPISITPPFWAKTSFRTICIFLAIIVISSLYRWRIYRLKHDRFILKLKVREATKNLKRSNEIISDQSEELIQTNEALINLNNQLEQRVVDRTTELTNINKILSDYAFINSHELRRPVSNILGLTQLLDGDLDNADLSEVKDALRKVARNLDNKVQEIQNKLT